MKKAIARAVLIILSVVVLTTIVSFLVWLVKPSHTLEIFILDKTVPTRDRREHKSLHWVLNHQKYVKNDNSLYRLKEDYYGFFPIDPQQQKFDFRSLSIRDVDAISDSVDLAYYADTYGVYYNDWYTGNSPDDEDEQKVYGGLNQNDYLLLKALKEKRKTIVTEFVLLDKSTSNLVRKKTEELLNLKWDGWIGKYFPSLSPGQCPRWITDLYQTQNKGQWTFSGPGIVLIHKYGKVVVLDQNRYLTSPLPVIETNDDIASRFGLPGKINYPNWFDITRGDSTAQVLASFNLNTNPEGDSLLKSYHLQSQFPAIIHHNHDCSFYYFAGDFSQNPVHTYTSYFQGIQMLDFLFYDEAQTSSSAQFFWKYYLPLTRQLLEDARQKSGGSERAKKTP